MASTEQSDSEQQQELSRLERLAQLLDSSVKVPFIPFRIGVESLVGLIPGVGDAVMAAVSLTIVYRGWRLGVGRSALMRMLLNVLVDFVVGAVPIAGDLFDMAFKANLRNVDIIKKAFQDKGLDQ